MKSTRLQDKILSAIVGNTNYPPFEIGMAYMRLKSFDRLISAIDRATEQSRSLSDIVDVLEGSHGN